MSDIPKEFNEEYYNQSYYATPNGKAYSKSDGSIEHWGYKNPTGEWQGALSIVESWALLFEPKKMLDVGCGRGTFIAYARDFEIEAEGFDFSEWAVTHPYTRCKPEWVRRHDALKPWPYKDNQFDFVIALDFFEHLYEPDIDQVADELFRVSGKWIFLQIATVDGVKEKGYKLVKGEVAPLDVEVYAAAGHVTVQTPKYWTDKFEHYGLKLRPDLTKEFFNFADADAVTNWKTNAILVYEKV
jgi:SAM-dependent methyltransferase